jgi:hypothetical protein
MQMSPGDLNDADRRVYRRWSVAFGIVYGIIALIFAGLIVNHPPITAEAVAQVEGMKSAEATGSIPVVPKRATASRRR